VLNLDNGIYTLSVAKLGKAAGEHCGIMLPAVHVSQPPANYPRGADIIAGNGGPNCWLGCEGGTVVVTAPIAGGAVLITSYALAGQASGPCEIAIHRIDGPAPVSATAGEAAPTPATRNIPIEILLHLEGVGDRRMSAEGWIGNLGKKLRVEAFSIRPLETLAPWDIEYKAYGPSGRETPWISNSKLCGTRGLGLPLTGFAVRLAPHLRDHFGTEYYGAFFESGICGPIRDGEPCVARIADDPLEAVNLRLFEHVAGSMTIGARRPG
jgi:hypothetical protein